VPASQAKPALTAYADQVLGPRNRRQLDAVAGDLATFARLVAAVPRLRGALLDPGLPKEARRALLEDLGKGRLDDAGVTLLANLASYQRVRPRGLAGLLAELSAEATFRAAEKADELDRVEDDLFRFGMLVARTPALRSALTDPALPLENKHALADDLLQGRATDRARALIELALDLDNGHDLDRTCQELSELAAARRDRVVAEVRSVVPLDDDRQRRLAEVLTQITGKRVELRTSIDQSIIGSLVVKLGDEVFDGSVRHRLEQAKQALGVA
jgi:F-type H+-transporting ATPase subunit delta